MISGSHGIIFEKKKEEWTEDDEEIVTIEGAGYRVTGARVFLCVERIKSFDSQGPCVDKFNFFKRLFVQ